VDPKPPLVFLGGNRPAGWNVVDLRFSYDIDTDTAYFGTAGTCGGHAGTRPADVELGHVSTGHLSPTHPAPTHPSRRTCSLLSHAHNEARTISCVVESLPSQVASPHSFPPPPLTLATTPPPPGINTGICITGDADCDGDPGAAGQELLDIDTTATDNARLDKGEFAVIVLNFAEDVASTDPTKMVRCLNMHPWVLPTSHGGAG
jgi:hypothetical protein